MIRANKLQFMAKHIPSMAKSTAASTNEEISKKLNEQENVKRFQMPFSRAKRGAFFQEQPVLGNQYLEDATLRSYLRRRIPKQYLTEIENDLTRFGRRVTGDIYSLGLECDRDLPKLKHFDAYGNRVDEVITCSAWKKMKQISSEEGLIAIGYERKFAEWSRLYQMSKLYLYSPSGGLYTCPLAMTDGAAKIIETLKDAELTKRAFRRLTSRDPAQFWTSGQWMTERRGGSDVARGTETLAVAQPDGSYRLYGYKWFTSATDADMTITLARVVDEHGEVVPGTRGLSMFYGEMKDENGKLNNLEIQRLKDKLGTRQVPTAELLLDGFKAYKISDDGRGVAGISDMLTMTRIHNALASVAVMRRIINFARDYCFKRMAFGKLLKDHPLHIKNMADMEVEARGALLLMLDMSERLGKIECGKPQERDAELLRLFTPIAKLYTAKQAMSVVSEGLECFGGLGYLEDSGLPLLFRDAQVLPIWEGTTNILSLDVLRALSKSDGSALGAFYTEVKERTSGGGVSLQNSSQTLLKAAGEIIGFAKKVRPEQMELCARQFAFSLARVYMGALLVDHASADGATVEDILAANRWCQKDLTPVLTHQEAGNYLPETSDMEFKLVMDGYTPDSKL